jgi:hypothetical protein
MESREGGGNLALVALIAGRSTVMTTPAAKYLEPANDRVQSSWQSFATEQRDRSRKQQKRRAA